MSSNERLTGKELGEILDRLAGAGKFKKQIPILKRLFRDADQIGLLKAAKALYPKVASESSVKSFHVFKGRLNTALIEIGASLMLVTDVGKGPVSTKTVYFLSERPEVTEIVAKVSGINSARLEDDGGAYNPSKFISRKVTDDPVAADLWDGSETPALDAVARFPRAVARTLSRFFPDLWKELPESDRWHLRNLAVIFEPIVEIRPGSAENPLCGFECVALGPDGRGYGSLMGWAKKPTDTPEWRIPPSVLDAALFVAAAETIEHYRRAMLDGWHAGRAAVDALRFHLNLTPALIDMGEVIHALVRECIAFPVGQLVLEVHESCEAKHCSPILRLKDAWGATLAMDDSGSLAADIKDALRAHVAVEKSDFRETRKLLDASPGYPDDAMTALKRRFPARQNLRGVILEGVLETSDVALLQRHWKEAPPVFVQGWKLPLKDQWGAPLQEYHRRDLGSGYVLRPEFGEPSDPQPKRKTMPLTGAAVEIAIDKHPHGEMSVFVSPLGKSFTMAPKVLNQHLTELCELLVSLNADIVVFDDDDPRYEHVKRKGGRDGRRTYHVVRRCEHPKAVKMHTTPPDRALGLVDDERSGLYRDRVFQRSLVEIKGATKAEPKDAMTFLNTWLDQSSKPFALLLGDYGMGKTFLCRMFARSLVKQREQGKPVPVPIYIDLRHVHFVRDAGGAQKIPVLPTLVKDVFDRLEYDIDAQLAIEAARAGRFLFIFDGLDEKVAHLTAKEADQFFEVLRSIHAAPGKARTILSGRTHYFKSSSEETNRARGSGGGGDAGQDGFRDDDFEIAYLLPFDEPRIRGYLEMVVGSERVESVLDTMGTIYDLKELSRRPYLLGFIAPRVDALAERQRQGEVVGAGTLYEQLVEEWLDRDEGKHFIRREEKPAIMGRLAHEFFLKGLTKIHHKKLDKWVTGPIRKFLSDENWVVGTPEDADRMYADVRTATFLSRDHEGNFSFAHRSFSEFFLARHLLVELIDGRSEVLGLPMIPREVADFFLDLLFVAEFRDDRPAVSSFLAGILEGAYRSRVSENALVLVHRWKQAGRGDSPSPARIEMPGANLDGARLSGASFTNVNWDGARFQRANLGGTHLRDLSARNAKFLECRLAGLRWQNAYLAHSIWLGSSIKYSDLTGADLSGAELTYVSLQNVQLDRARLTGASCVGADWNDVSATHSDVTGADLSGIRGVSIDFTGASGTCANMRMSGWARSTPPGIAAIAGGPPINAFIGSKIEQTTEFESINAEMRRILRSREPFETRGKLQYSRDGRSLWAATSNALNCYDAKTLRLTQTLNSVGNVVDFDLSPNQRFLASGGRGGEVHLWDASTGAMIREMKGHTAPVSSVSWSPDGTRLASAGGDEIVRLWDADTGAMIREMKTNTNWFISVKWSPSGTRLASGGDEGSIRLWDADTGAMILTTNEHTEMVLSVAWAPDGTHLASGDGDGKVRIWNADTGLMIREIGGHSIRALDVAWAPDGARLASAGADGTIRLWDVDTGAMIREMQGRTENVSSIAWTPNGAHLASRGGDGTFNLWDAETGATIREIGSRSGSDHPVAWSPGGTCLAWGGGDGKVRFWDADTGAMIREMKGHVGWAWSVAWSPDGKRLASAGFDKKICLWDADTGAMIREMKGHIGWVWSVAWSPDGKRLASAGVDKTICLWDADTGAMIREMKGHTSWVWTVAWSPNGTCLAAAGGGESICLWDLETDAMIREMKGHDGWTWSVSWSPDGARLASAGSDRTVRLWDAGTGEMIREMKGHIDSVSSVAWAPDGTRLTSAGADGTVYIWNSDSGKMIREMRGSGYAAWSPDGSRLASAGAGGTVRLWDANTGAAIREVWQLPDGEWATVEEGRIRWRSSGALRLLDYDLGDGAFVPAEAFEDDSGEVVLVEPTP